MMNLTAACRPGFDIVLVDVGAAGGLKGRWKSARPVVSAIMFEPRDDGEPRREERDIFYPVALGPTTGRTQLHLTEALNMSSTLRPDQSLFDKFEEKGKRTLITRSLDVPMETLDSVMARDGRKIDVIKVDTQGSELGILHGARESVMKSCLVAEIEVSFFHRYQGQALFRDIDAYMAELGFEFVDFLRLKRYQRRNSFRIRKASIVPDQRAGRLSHADALFILREDRLLERIAAGGEDVAMKTLIALIAYGKLDMAAALFDQTRDRFEPQRREQVARFFAQLGRSIGRHKLHILVDHLARRI